MPDSRPVVVTGATGRIGRTVLRSLSAKGIAARALSREPARVDHLPGVTAVAADLSDPSTLPDAFAGGGSVFLLTSADERLVELQTNALRAATDAGIRRLVKLSALGASDHSNSTVGRWHYAVGRAILAGPFDWTILRPHYFMDNLLDRAKEVRTTQRLVSPIGPAAIPFIDSRDIGEVGAATLSTSGHEGRKYVLTGGESVGYARVAELLAEILGRPIAYAEESLDDAERRLTAAGRPTWESESTRALWAYQRAGGPTAIVSPDVARILGKPPRTLREFLSDHRAEFDIGLSGPRIPADF